MQIQYADIVGKDHVKVRLTSEGGGNVDAIAFRAVGSELGSALQKSAGRTLFFKDMMSAQTAPVSKDAA